MEKVFRMLLIVSSLTFHITSVASQTLPKWGLVYGSDSEFGDARREILRFNNPDQSKIPPQFRSYNAKAALFFRQGTYRSVLLFYTEQEAEQALPMIERTLTDIDKRSLNAPPTWQRGSFVVNLNAWCPKWDSQPTKKQGITQYSCK